MPPPNARRTSTEPVDDKDSKRRKIDHQDDNVVSEGRRDKETKDRVDRKRGASVESSKDSGNTKKSERKKDIEASSNQNGSSVTSGSKRSKKKILMHLISNCNKILMTYLTIAKQSIKMLLQTVKKLTFPLVVAGVNLKVDPLVDVARVKEESDIKLIELLCANM